MKKIYCLELALEADPSRVEAAQKLTLDESRPLMGQKGVYGLYGSPQWWGNLTSGKIPIREYAGIIETVQFEGMNNESRSFTLALENGGHYNYSCVANKRQNLKHYKLGRNVRVVTFIEIMKDGRDHEFLWSIEIEI